MSNDNETFYMKMFTIETNESWLKETEGYHQFVRTKLDGAISKFAYGSYSMQIIKQCWGFLEGLDLRTLSYVVIFLKKYNLIDVYIDKNYDVNCVSEQELTPKIIWDAYKKELAYVNEKTGKITKPSIFERLEGYATMEERQAHIKELSQNYQESLRETQYENAYNNFIKDRENGLYRILEHALIDFDFRGFVLTYNNWHISYSFIKEFCDKYGIEVNMIERNDKINKDLLVNITTIENIRYLFQCFFGELQKIEHYSKRQDQLWEENKSFVSNNKEWLEKRKGR